LEDDGWNETAPEVGAADASLGSTHGRAGAREKPTTQVAGEGELRIEYMRLDRLPPAPRNAKKHDVPGIRSSFARFGFVSPPIINEGTGNLVAGHGRIEVLTEDHRKGKRKPPKRIRVDPADGMWMVPVYRGIRFDSDADAELYVLADNKLQERAGYDNDILAEMFQDHSRDDLGIAGFDTSEIDELLEPELDIDATRSLPPGDSAEAFIFREVRILLSKDTANRLGSVIEQYAEQRGTYNGFVEYVLERIHGGADV